MLDLTSVPPGDHQTLNDSGLSLLSLLEGMRQLELDNVALASAGVGDDER